jgi:DNA repair exonuclease SbcCD ATPase subunit
VPKLDAEIDNLYQLPLDEFTAARNALAKDAGPQAAAEIRALQKPPVAAWAVNQLYWKRRPVYDALIDASSELRQAHAAVLSGKRADLRMVSKDHEEALESALKAALEILKDSAHAATDATRQAVATTLRGLPSEEPPGRLSRTLQPGGFEMLAGIPVRGTPARKEATVAHPSAAPARAATSATEKQKDRDAGKPTAAESKTLARAREAVTSANRALKSAEHAAQREEFEAARAVRDAEKATKEVESARRELEAAQRELEEVQHRAETAERRRDEARERADAADAAVKEARERLREAERELSSLSRGGR